MSDCTTILDIRSGPCKICNYEDKIGILEIKSSETFEDIKSMKKNKFVKLISTKIDIAALEYLTSRQKRKGSEMFYSEIIMSEYLMPQTELNISEKRDMFAVKNRMTDISSNFSSNKEIEKCWCGENLNMEHIYMCSLLNSEITDMPYNKLFNGSLNEQVEVYKRFRNNMSEREKRIKNDEENLPHAIPLWEPQSSGLESCNGSYK